VTVITDTAKTTGNVKYQAIANETLPVEWFRISLDYEGIVPDEWAGFLICTSLVSQR
jgi:hypothetical protein